jgi:hypothetical protein
MKLDFSFDHWQRLSASNFRLQIDDVENGRLRSPFSIPELLQSILIQSISSSWNSTSKEAMHSTVEKLMNWKAFLYTLSPIVLAMGPQHPPYGVVAFPSFNFLRRLKKTLLAWLSNPISKCDSMSNQAIESWEDEQDARKSITGTIKRPRSPSDDSEDGGDDYKRRVRLNYRALPWNEPDTMTRTLASSELFPSLWKTQTLLENSEFYL